MKRVVLDESALLVFLKDCDGAEEVEQLLQKALIGEVAVLIPVSTWSAVSSAVLRSKGRNAGEQLLSQLCQLPLSFVDIDHAGAQKAADLAAADAEVGLLTSFAGAVAYQRKATLVSANGVPPSLERQLKVQRVGVADKDKR